MKSLILNSLNDDSHKSLLLRRGIGNIFISGTSTLLSFGVAVILTRLLGASNFGIYTYYLEIVLIAVIPAQFGLPNLIVRETAKGLETKEWGAIKGLWNWSTLITSSITVLIIVFAGIYLGFNNSIINTNYKYIILWGILLIPLSSLTALRGASLRGLHQVIRGQLPDNLIQPGLYFLFIILSAVIFHDTLNIQGAFFFQVLAAGIAFIFGAFVLIRYTPQELKLATPAFKNRIWAKSAFSLALLNGIDVLNRRISIILLGFLVSSAQIGIFKVALQMANFTEFGLRVINPILAPEIAKHYAQQNKQMLQQLATQSSRIILLLNLFISIVYLFCGKSFLLFFFGREYLSAFGVILILILGQLINSMTGPVVMFLNMTGHENDTVKARSGALIMTAILIFLLTPAIGISGTAMAISIGMIFWNVMLAFFAYKRLGIVCLPISFSHTIGLQE